MEQVRSSSKLEELLTCLVWDVKGGGVSDTGNQYCSQQVVPLFTQSNCSVD